MYNVRMSARFNLTVWMRLGLLGGVLFQCCLTLPVHAQTKGDTASTPTVYVQQGGKLSLDQQSVTVNTLIDEINGRVPKPASVRVRTDYGATWEQITQVIKKLDAAKIAVQFAPPAAP